MAEGDEEEVTGLGEGSIMEVEGEDGWGREGV